MKKLTEFESRKILEKYKIRLPKAELAKSEEEAAKIAKKIGYPVVIKLMSADALHKTNVGGVMVNMENEECLRDGYRKILANAKKHGNIKVDGILVEEMLSGRQVIVGSVQDPQFGSVVMFGLGGVFVEVLKDVSFRVVPLSKKDAMDMINEVKSKSMLDEFRGEKAANKEALVDAILKVSKMLESEGNISELDINPLFVNEKEAVAGDARIVLK